MNPEGIVTKALEQNIYFGLLVALIIVILIYFNRKEEAYKKSITDLWVKIDQKDDKLIQIQVDNNERLMKIQSDQITAMNNQTTAIKAVEMILQSMRNDIERIKDK